jgi:hypothetical protein
VPRGKWCRRPRGKINISNEKNYSLRSIKFQLFSQIKGSSINNCDLFPSSKILLQVFLFSRPRRQNKHLATPLPRTNIYSTLTRLRARRSGVRIPATTRYFPLLQNAQTGSGAHPASYLMSTGVLSRGVKLTTHLPLVPWWKVSGAILRCPYTPSWHGQGEVYLNITW